MSILLKVKRQKDGKIVEYYHKNLNHQFYKNFGAFSPSEFNLNIDLKSEKDIEKLQEVIKHLLSWPLNSDEKKI